MTTKICEQTGQRLYLYQEGDISFYYTIIQKPHIKHLYIRIKENIAVVTGNKHLSSSVIKQFVHSKSHWIDVHLHTTQKQLLLTDHNAHIYLLGDSYRVRVDIDPAIKKESMQIEGTTAKFILATKPDHGKLQTLRDAYYKQQCPTVITPLVIRYARSMDLSPGKIGYRHNRSRWGSCSSENNLSLNTRLMMLPESTIIYVVVHELAHISHKNHSESFWRLVKHYCPAYKELRRDMRAFERLL